jgi:hypothetical protein
MLPVELNLAAAIEIMRLRNDFEPTIRRIGFNGDDDSEESRSERDCW